MFLEPAASRLNALGFRIVSVPELGLNHRSVPESAVLVARSLAGLGESRCILLAHSKGGLIGKQLMLDILAMKHDAGPHLCAPSSPVEVLGMVAVATPFSGSSYARFMLPRTLREFSPADAGLLALAQQTQLNHKVVSIYPEFDPHIPGGSALEAAVNIEVPVSAHFRVLSQPTVLAAVEHAVKGLVL